MIGDAIELVLTNIPIITFVAALLIARLHPKGEPAAEHYLSWLLLLPVGFNNLWAGVYNAFFPEISAAYIGWQVSPFQFEIGVCDIALGITAMLAFWRPLDFKIGIATFAALFFIGVAIGHVRQAVVAGNYDPGNVGIMLFVTIATAVLLIALSISADRSRAAPRVSTTR